MHPKFTMKQMERFFSRVDKASHPDGCWLWTGNRMLNGYGRYGQRTAHRLSYEMHHGPIRDGLMVCHRCGNRACVNPEHLYAGTARDNARDMIEHGTPTQVLTRNKNAKRGAENVLAKLTDDEVREIRRLYAEGGHTLSALGKMFGVAATNIHSIVRRHTWSHVD